MGYNFSKLCDSTKSDILHIMKTNPEMTSTELAELIYANTKVSMTRWQVAVVRRRLGKNWKHSTSFDCANRRRVNFSKKSKWQYDNETFKICDP